MLRTLMLLCVLLFSTIARAEEQPRIISTTGESVIYVVPDEVVLDFGVESYSPDLMTAKTENDKLSKSLMQAVQGLGIEEKYISTSNVEVSLDYRNNNSPSRGIEGYTVRRTYSVRLKNVTLLEKLVDTVLQNGANIMSGVEFRSTELRKHRDEARKMAIRAAKEKAELLAGELGVKVGKPRNISENAVSYGGWTRRDFRGMAQNSFQDMSGGASDGEGSMPLGQIAIRATVSVNFDLE